MNSANVQPIPDGMHSVTPHLICARAADAIEFYQRVFGATELSRVVSDDGHIMYASLRIGDSVIMLTEEFPQWNSLGPLALKGTPVTIHLYVEDVDGFFDGAVAAGANVKMPVDDMFWGDRYGVLEDPFGHRWSIATHKREVGPDEIHQAMRKMSASGCEQGEPT